MKKKCLPLFLVTRTTRNSSHRLQRRENSCCTLVKSDDYETETEDDAALNLYFFYKILRYIFTYLQLYAIISKDESEIVLCFPIKAWSKN